MTQKQTERTLSGKSGLLTYTLERKSVKNINLRILRDGSVWASANSRVPAERVDAFVLSKEAYIRQAQSRFADQAKRAPDVRTYDTGEQFWMLGKPFVIQTQQGSLVSAVLQGEILVLTIPNPGSLEQRRKAFDSFWDEQCHQIYARLMAEAYPPFAAKGIARPSLKIRDMKTRWGTCHTQKKVITLNRRLLAAPLPCIWYVLQHEYCHLIQPDHSKRFYVILEQLLPNWKQLRKTLNNSPACW